MIAVLVDKFKGTLSGSEVASIMGEVLGECVYVPMADGGEGTVEALGAVRCGDFYAFEDTDGRTVGYVPSCGEGLGFLPEQEHIPLRQRSSAAVGLLVSKALRKFHTVYVGIGGTRVADGGVGFAKAMHGCRGKIIGLADIEAPLIAEEGISAMSFLAQKGATEEDVVALREKFSLLKLAYPSDDRFGGAGGGIGFAIESIVGGDVISGAQYILRRNLSRYLHGQLPDLLITGEGCVDEQTGAGKVVAAVNAYGREHGIPVVTFAGIVKGNPGYDHVFPSYTVPPVQLPTPAEAADRLRKAVADAIPLIRTILSNK